MSVAKDLNNNTLLWLLAFRLFDKSEILNSVMKLSQKHGSNWWPGKPVGKSDDQRVNQSRPYISEEVGGV